MPAKESINIGQYFVIGLTVPYPMFRARQIYWSTDGATPLKGARILEDIWERRAPALYMQVRARGHGPGRRYPLMDDQQ